MAPWIVKSEGFHVDSFLTLYATRKDALIAVQNVLVDKYHFKLPFYYKTDGDRERSIRAALQSFLTGKVNTRMAFHIRDIAEHEHVSFTKEEINGLECCDFTDYIDTDEEEDDEHVKALKDENDKLKKEIESLKQKPTPVKVEVLDLSASPLLATNKRPRQNSREY